MRITACAVAIALAAFSAPGTGIAQPTAPSSPTETILVRLSNFAFDPERLRLTAGVPVRLRLVNESGGGHNFSSPELFSASNILPGGSAPSNGELAVASHQTVEVVLVPRTPGTYRVECTHFLHSFFGMHGTIEVIR
jgi:plastocyanin